MNRKHRIAGYIAHVGLGLLAGVLLAIIGGLRLVALAVAVVIIVGLAWALW